MARGKLVAPTTVDELERMVNSRYGAGTMMRGSDPALEIERLSTGVLAADWGLGGGFARGRHSEIYGPPGTGKTTLSYYTIAQTQRDGGRCAFIDVEDKYDAVYAAQCGVNVEDLTLHIQEDGNTVIDLEELWIRSGLYDLIVLDSIAALLPQQDREQSMADGGGFNTHQAKLMSKAMRKLTAANKTTALLYINQVREDLSATFIKRNVTSGGRAMSHYAATRIEMVRAEMLKRKKSVIGASGKKEVREVPYGHRVLMRIQKEQTGGAHEGDTTTFVFDYELGGIDPVEDLIYLGLQYDLVHGGESSWYVVGYEDERQKSRDKFKEWLRQNRAVAQELEENIINVGEAEEE